MNKKQQSDHLICKRVLLDCLGTYHSIAMSSENDKTTWQVMPEAEKERPFFDWYCWNFENEQFFENIHECVILYLFWREKWIDLGKPNWRDNFTAFDKNAAIKKCSIPFIKLKSFLNK